MLATQPRVRAPEWPQRAGTGYVGSARQHAALLLLQPLMPSILMIIRLGSISGPKLPVKSRLIKSTPFFSNCDILGVKIIRIDPLEPNIWLYCVYYAVLQLFNAEVWSARELNNSSPNMVTERSRTTLCAHTVSRLLYVQEQVVEWYAHTHIHSSPLISSKNRGCAATHPCLPRPRRPWI